MFPVLYKNLWVFPGLSCSPCKITVFLGYNLSIKEPRIIFFVNVHAVVRCTRLTRPWPILFFCVGAYLWTFFCCELRLCQRSLKSQKRHVERFFVFCICSSFKFYPLTTFYAIIISPWRSIVMPVQKVSSQKSDPELNFIIICLHLI